MLRTNQQLAEDMIRSIERMTPAEKQALRDSIRLQPFRDAAREAFYGLKSDERPN